MALGEDDVNSGNISSAGSTGAVTPSESTIEIVASESAATPVLPTRPRRSLGRPRVSTVVLMSVWVAALVLYLQVRPGG